MAYNTQPRVPAGSSHGGEWKSSTFHNDAAQWVHPTTGERRIYLNSHDAGNGNKVWIHESDANKTAMKWDASMKSEGYGQTSSASVRAGSNNQKDIALTAAEMKIKQHGGNPSKLTFEDIWKQAKPYKATPTANTGHVIKNMHRSFFEKLSPVEKMNFARNGGNIIG